MSCQCHQIGGPFIAEDPDCPKHGIYGRELREQAEAMIERIRAATDFNEVADLCNQLDSIVEQM